MSSQQQLTTVAVYPRVIRASLTRIWENVLDWEHLPWLHSSTFSGIEPLASGPDGWRARIGLVDSGATTVEIVLDRPRIRYVTRTLEGIGTGTEIWTRLEPIDTSSTRIEVEFLVPGVRSESRDAIGARYVTIYTRLWDEDEAMMRRRESLLSRNHAAGRASAGISVNDRILLGPRRQLNLPVCVDVGSRGYRVVELDGDLIAHSTECPHRLGPLDDAAVKDGCVRCPWHGYRFDVRTGLNPDGCTLALEPAPRVEVHPTTTDVFLVVRRP